MIPPKTQNKLTSLPSFLSSRGREIFCLAVLLSVGLPGTVKGQLEFTDDFNSGTLSGRWGNYDPGSGLGQVNSRTFVSDGAGGLALRQYGPGTGSCANIINRGGVYATAAGATTYGEFLESADIL